MKPEKKRLDASENPDVEISARVKTRELRFEEVPETGTQIWGHTELESVSGTERENLPEEVKSGVTYRNSSIRLRIAGKLSDANPGLQKKPEGG